MAYRGSAGSSTEMVFDSVLSDRAHYEKATRPGRNVFSVTYLVQAVQFLLHRSSEMSSQNIRR